MIVEENNSLLGSSRTSREFLDPRESWRDEELLQRSELVTATD